ALAALAAAITLAPSAAQARGKPAAQPTGYLCCNLVAFGGEIYDINYADDDAVVLPFGTPVTVTGGDRRKLRFTANGRRYVLENHYSRDLSEAAFHGRYVVADDPRAAAAAFPEKIRQAIVDARVTPG